MAKISRAALVTISGLLFNQSVFAQEAATAEELAKKLSNPIASLISVPFQYNYDEGLGPDDTGTKSTLNIQPVIPVAIGENWNMISRTILPVINQNAVFAGAGRQEGIGDIVQSLFFSPTALTERGWTWGAGPVILIPTGSEDELTADNWGLGPTGIALKQQGPWTFGGLANHVWSVDEKPGDPIVNATFLQPFLSHTNTSAVTLTLNSESTYNWESKEWSAPVHFNITKMSRVGNQMISWGAGARYYVDSSENGANGWGARLLLTLLYPK